MKRELAHDITTHLTPQAIKALEEFADWKIETAKTNLSFAETLEVVRREQGIIRSMEELKKIRQTAVNVLKMEK